MANDWIEDDPEETHAALRRRADFAYRSPQEHPFAEIVAEAGTPSPDDVLARAGSRTGGSLSFRDAVEAVHDDRDRR